MIVTLFNATLFLFFFLLTITLNILVKYLVLQLLAAILKLFHLNTTTIGTYTRRHEKSPNVNSPNQKSAEKS